MHMMSIYMKSRALTIYTIYSGGNFWSIYSVLQLVQTKNEKKSQNVPVSIIGKFKKKIKMH